MNKVKVTPEMVKQIKKMHENGLSNGKIAEKFKISESTVRYWLDSDKKREEARKYMFKKRHPDGSFESPRMWSEKDLINMIFRFSHKIPRVPSATMILMFFLATLMVGFYIGVYFGLNVIAYPQYDPDPNPYNESFNVYTGERICINNCERLDNKTAVFTFVEDEWRCVCEDGTIIW